MKAELRKAQDRVAGFGSQVSSAALLAMSKGTKVDFIPSGHQDTRNATNMDQASGQIGRSQSANNHLINQGNNALRLQQLVTPDITNAQKTMAARTVRKFLKTPQDESPSRKEDKSKRNSQQEQEGIADRKKDEKKKKTETKRQKAIEEAEKKGDLKKANRLRSLKKEQEKFPQKFLHTHIFWCSIINEPIPKLKICLFSFRILSDQLSFRCESNPE